MMIGENYPLNASTAAKVTTSFLLVITPAQKQKFHSIVNTIKNNNKKSKTNKKQKHQP
ncbi:TPA: hypothetical protein RXO55_004973 [Escherichia coli]|nr:hypothetical protein [Escherichia coli]HEA8699764.1 hypothetical protein [Escherichia coli]